MKQQDFEDRLSDINQRHTEAILPFREKLDKLNKQMLEIRVAISKLQLELSELSVERSRVEISLKECKQAFHAEKHTLNLQWREKLAKEEFF